MKKRVFSLATAIAVTVVVFMASGCKTSAPPVVTPPDAPPVTQSEYNPTTPPEVTTTPPPDDPENPPEITTPTIPDDPLNPPEVTTSPPPDDPLNPPEVTTSPPPDDPLNPPEVTTSPVGNTTPTITTSTASVIITTAPVPAAPGPAAPSPPIVLLPVASDVKVSDTAKSVIDYSNTSDGYVMLKYKGSNTRIILRITAPNGIVYQFEPAANNEWKAFPLSEGNGKYTVEFFEGTAGTTAVSPVDKIEIDVSIANAHKPFLMANYYVNYTSSSAVVTKASELAAGMTSDIDKITAIYNWFVENITYDQAKSDSALPASYVPNLGDLMRDKKGICYDYASGMAAMLRSQGIPTRLEIGYAGDTYHAWVSVYTKETGWVNGWIRFEGSKWSLMEPTWAAVNKDTNQNFRNFVLGGNHETLFSY
jgi:transglutaminase-like putative cysteine protease